MAVLTPVLLLAVVGTLERRMAPVFVGAVAGAILSGAISGIGRAVVCC